MFSYLNHVDGHLLQPNGLEPFLEACSVPTCFDKRLRVFVSKLGQYFCIHQNGIVQEITHKNIILLAKGKFRGC